MALTKVNKATVPTQHRKKTVHLSFRGIEAKNFSLNVNLTRIAEQIILKHDLRKVISISETPRNVSMSLVRACAMASANAIPFTMKNTFKIKCRLRFKKE